jgi:glycerate dehydrogenase
MKIVILNGEVLPIGSPAYVEMAAFGQVTVYETTPDPLVAERIGDAEIVFTDSSRITRSVMEQCSKIRYIGILASGCNSVDVAYAAQRGITVRNVPGYAAANVAQHGFALLLHLCSHVRQYEEAVSKGLWDKNPAFAYAEHPQLELEGKTMGIVGFGPIGQKMARIAAGFGMKVLVYSKYADFYASTMREGADPTFQTLDFVLENADVLSLHCPLDDSTRQMIDGTAIGKMKDGVILLNTARGGLIDEAALAAALRSGKVAAAGLDVLTSEPPDPNCPLLGLANCAVTPHIGWNSKEARDRLLRSSIDNLAAFLAHEGI